MNTKRIFGWALIIGAAILVSAAIIFLPASAYSANKNYQENYLIDSKQDRDPQEIVMAFYDQYLDAFGEPSAGTRKNPLEEKAYRHNEYLSPSFIQRIDDLLENMGNQGGYDPFLCAQDIPGYFQQAGTFHHGGIASVIMKSDFPNHVITLDLALEGDNWKISNISCAKNPDEVVRAFYTWYLAYMGDRSSGELNNPLADGAYRDCGFLSGDLIDRLDEMGSDGFQFDPILTAQDIPHDFSVDPGSETGTAIVHLQFGSDTVVHLKISLVEDLGVWHIDRIERAEP